MSGKLRQSPETGEDVLVRSLQSLPEDIIRCIFAYLPRLSDKVHLACVDPKFRHIFERWARNQKNILDAEDVELMTLPDIIDFFTVAGPFIQVLQVDCASFEKESLVVEFIVEFCKNLEEIYYTNVADEFHYRTIMAKSTKLKKVSIDCIDVDDVLTFDLEANQDLEHFELAHGCYSGKHLCGFSKLRTLVLRDCLLWNSGEFGIPLKSLKVLDLDDCCFEVSNQSLFDKITESCLELEELSFSGSDMNFEVIAQLPELKRCTLKTWMTSNELNLGFLAQLAEQKGNKLTTLHLSGQFLFTNEHVRYLGQLSSLKELRWTNNDVLEDDHFKFFNDLPLLETFALSWCGQVTDLGLMRLLRKCEKLKVIDLTDCELITNEFVINAIACCAKSSLDRHLVVNSKGTKIKETMLSHPEYLAYLNHVKLNFIDK